jgi:NitT/TauT family transport system substrate-binding protein
MPTHHLGYQIAIGVIFGCLLLGCGASSPPSRPGLQPVKLQLNWVPEAEHGGFYAALEHGFYEQMGLDVEIIPGGVSAPVTQQLAMNRVQFGVMNADWVILGRNNDAKIKALMAPIQDSPRCLLVRPEAQIHSLADFRDITLAAKPEDPFLEFTRQALGWEQKNVTVVPYLSMQAFFSNEKYAQQGYSFSEPFLARAQGIEPVVLMVSELGYNPYTSCLVADQSLIQSDPALVRKFVQASIRGWERYLADPESTNRRISQLNPDQTMDSLNFALEDIRRLCRWDEQLQRAPLPVGTMERDRFVDLGKSLAQIGFISTSDPSIYEQAFTLEFLPEQPESPPGAE